MNRRVALICQRTNNVPFLFEASVNNAIDLVVVHSPEEAAPVSMPGVIGALELPVFDEPERAIELFKQWVQQYPPLDGVISQREEALIWTAQAALAVGLPSLTPDVIYGARDKGKMREKFKAFGCNVPRFAWLRNENDITLCTELPYPLVVKPSSAFGSAGVIRVDNAAELKQALDDVFQMNRQLYGRFSNFDGQTFDGVIVEEFLSGAEYCAECFSVNGEPHVLVVAYKGNPQGPFFEESIYLTPPMIPSTLQQSLISEAKKGMRALGLSQGPGHCEMRLNSEGKPCILEIGARLGGSATSHFMVEAATGIDYAGLQLAYVTGANLSAIPSDPVYTGSATNWIIPLGGYGIFDGIVGLDEIKQHPDFRRILLFAKPGDVFRPYPQFDGFVGFILGQHATATDAEAFINTLSSTIKTVWK